MILNKHLGKVWYTHDLESTNCKYDKEIICYNF